MLATSKPSVASPEYTIEFSTQRQNGDFENTSAKLLHWNGRGHRWVDSAWSFVISAVSAMKTKGARKSSAQAISRLWFATPIRKRRRRTSGGSLRRTIDARA